MHLTVLTEGELVLFSLYKVGRSGPVPPSPINHKINVKGLVVINGRGAHKKLSSDQQSCFSSLGISLLLDSPQNIR